MSLNWGSVIKQQKIDHGNNVTTNKVIYHAIFCICINC